MDGRAFCFHHTRGRTSSFCVRSGRDLGWRLHSTAKSASTGASEMRPSKCWTLAKALLPRGKILCQKYVTRPVLEAWGFWPHCHRVCLHSWTQVLWSGRDTASLQRRLLWQPLRRTDFFFFCFAAFQIQLVQTTWFHSKKNLFLFLALYLKSALLVLRL